MPKKKNRTGIPDQEIDSLARVLLPALQMYLATDEGQKEFAAWQDNKN